MRILRLPLLCLLLLLPTVLPAQYRIKNILFRNAGAYPQPDLLAIAALKVGDKLDRPRLQAAAARLMGTGYFQEVVGSLDGPIVSIDVRFDLKPVDPALLLPVGLENFIWFTPEELAAFRKSVPLLSSGLPEAGDARTRVQTALEQLLAAKSIAATVSHEIVEATTAHPIRAFEYRVDKPSIVLGAVHLWGGDMGTPVGPRTFTAKKYNEGLTGALTSDSLLAPYLDAGYLDARLDALTRTPAAPPGDPLKVDVTATVQPGAQYRIGTIAFTPTPLFTAEAFLKELKLHPNDPASQKLLLLACAAVTTAYHREGYLDVYLRTGETKDSATHMVSYTPTVVPGEQYKLKSILILNLPEALHPEVDKALKLHPGDVFREAVVGNFLFNQDSANPLAGYHGNYSVSADPNTHLVDLTLEFTGIKVRAR